MRLLILALAALTLTACATAQRYDAAGDVHALLVSIRDNDKAAFEAHVDRPALKRQIESRMMAETRKSGANDGLAALGALLAPTLAELAGEALIQPTVFRSVAAYYGYDASKPLPGPMVIGGQLKTVGEGQVCVPRKKDGPCLLTFTQEQGTWRLSGFEGDLSMLQTKAR
ncbi:hypothetical protein ASE17_13560 [Phenylobacterium sp. Root77]|uniref:DUF2939 domain-containing protein n=1 Tax=unclassified Phenylobacterium TaxID=2640670 RepID=UPI0006F9B5C2|nr:MULTISPECIES: DUF2939 domain-containing protein [unclassified Phenylobacterium]KQW69084.1 hypothetical protein ASC73_14075 [Phenylobacterium sp. Root1277]KQW95549.1 hypothetical protein ASC79_07610 [Phenylobacterium sp. Root1290]KRC41338.1 hypothetical protein ASE17_13560 [Phenylobacterium sp. Root77]